MNNWLDKLERKFSRYAIPNLITYIIILYAAGFALELINPTFYSQAPRRSAALVKKRRNPCYNDRLH